MSTKKYKISACFLLMTLVVPFSAWSQSKSVYDKSQVFDPAFNTYTVNDVRSANGSPGEKYWQNSADYTP